MRSAKADEKYYPVVETLFRQLIFFVDLNIASEITIIILISNIGFNGEDGNKALIEEKNEAHIGKNFLDGSHA